jgi:predicted HicB family RNase H-like nuclease
MTGIKFKKAPLSPIEKEKKAEEFISFLDTEKVNGESVRSTVRKLEKESVKSFSLRIPSTLFDDLREIAAVTGISINSICLELLRPCVKKKLKELRESE